MHTWLGGIFWRLSAGFVAGSMAVAAQAAVITFSDTEFNLANYSTPSIFSSGAVSSNIVQTSSGNPGNALETSLRATGPFQFTAGVVRNGFTYNPAQFGAVSTIDVSLDRIALRTINGVPDIVSTYTLRPLILQGGNFFQAVSPPIIGTNANNENVWATLSLANLTAIDFGLYDFATGILDTAIHPNFNDTMTLGFITAIFGDGASVTTAALTRNDNWQVTLTTVPEPSTVVLLTLGLAGLALARRRKQ